ACSKVDSYLDKAESGGIDKESLFTKYNRVDGFLANIYRDVLEGQEWMMLRKFQLWNSTDDAHNNRESPMNQVVNMGGQDPTNAPLEDFYPVRYRAIRKAHLFLDGINEFSLDP